MPDALADVRRAFRQFERDMERAMVQATRRAADALLEEMQGLTSAIDHSLKDLAALGHPYGWGRPPNEPHVDWIVHEQGGDLLGGLKRGRVRDEDGVVTGEIHSNSAHTWYLAQGTKWMRPRDFVSAALLYRQEEIREIFQRAHAGVHDAPGHTPNYRPEIKLIPHDQYPAELPETD